MGSAFGSISSNIFCYNASCSFPLHKGADSLTNMALIAEFALF